MVGGVCAGLGRYLDLDPTLIRALFIGSLAVGGFGPATYVALWILLGSETSVPSPTRPAAARDDLPLARPSTPDPASPDVVVTDTTVGVD